ncbi:MAG: aminotransferase class I/II-fold pyridoxal phosphate-dependent enzyme [Candidatus Bathyarchaeota archaeon]|nr:aminotransferase class I/II-fold pyridoxal phosphate-dependent enzyme [Candidatus Bathyarchaeota archaeon]MDP7443202.1 aminotransferase class I/II-fold pyridoxal phosphate-dependent enzyme [Candidatus Bathyarchaeota archaeon]|tara:strand:- start:20 stop:1237 length:1218 start_codon:yes stop_codon:yes gene_type:complete
MKDLRANRWGYDFKENPAPPPTLRQTQRALSQEGKSVLALAPGDPPAAGYPPPQWLMDAVNQAMKDGRHGYRDTRTAELPIGIAKFEKEFSGVHYDPGDIFPVPSSTSAMVLCYLALLDEGDEIISPEPIYQQYSFFANYYKTKMVKTNSFEDDRWQPDLDAIRKAVTDKTKFIIINNPNNPSGAVYDDKTLKGLIDIAGENEIMIFSDEIYTFLTFDIPQATSVAKLAKDVPVMLSNGMSKLFNITGWGLGYLAYHDPEDKMPELRSAIRMLRGYCGRVASPVAVAAAYGYQNWKRAMEEVQPEVEDIRRRRDWVVKRIAEINGINLTTPEGSMFGLPDCVPAHGDVWKDDVDFLVQLMKEELIGFVPGSNYYSLGHFRVGFLSSDENLRIGFDKLEKFMKRHT